MTKEELNEKFIKLNDINSKLTKVKAKFGQFKVKCQDLNTELK